MLPGRRGRLDLSRLSHPPASPAGVSPRFEGARWRPGRRLRLASRRPRLRGRSSRLVTGQERAGGWSGGRAGHVCMSRVCPSFAQRLAANLAGQTGRSGKLRLVPERRGPERVPGHPNHTFYLHHLQRVKSIYILDYKKTKIYSTFVQNLLADLYLIMFGESSKLSYLFLLIASTHLPTLTAWQPLCVDIIWQ